jgi:hypothetical protein
MVGNLMRIYFCHHDQENAFSRKTPGLRIIVIARSVTLNLSSPKERKPMMGFWVVLISRTGAKLN